MLRSFTVWPPGARDGRLRRPIGWMLAGEDVSRLPKGLVAGLPYPGFEAAKIRLDRARAQMSLGSDQLRADEQLSAREQAHSHACRQRPALAAKRLHGQHQQYRRQEP